jgi:hypothetical protein
MNENFEMSFDDLKAFVQRIICQKLTELKPYTIGEHNPDVWEIIEDGFIREMATPSLREILKDYGMCQRDLKMPPHPSVAAERPLLALITDELPCFGALFAGIAVLRVNF